MEKKGKEKSTKIPLVLLQPVLSKTSFLTQQLDLSFSVPSLPPLSSFSSSSSPRKFYLEVEILSSLVSSSPSLVSSIHSPRSRLAIVSPKQASTSRVGGSSSSSDSFSNTKEQKLTVRSDYFYLTTQLSSSPPFGTSFLRLEKNENRSFVQEKTFLFVLISVGSVFFVVLLALIFILIKQLY